MVEGNIAKRWRLLSGEDNWKTLLDPLDIDLRRYLIHYGERTQANYDAFIEDPRSKYAGASKFAKKNLFSQVGLEKNNPYKYKVVEYFYATSVLPNFPTSFIVKSLVKDSWGKGSNWMGYVAVTTNKGKAAMGRRDILVAWRGTVEQKEWVDNINFPLEAASKIFGESTLAKVHRGWLSLYTSSDPKSLLNKTSARDQVLAIVKQLVEKYKNEETSITITGHSLGASMATLCGFDIAFNGFKNLRIRHLPITVFAYASPYVGNLVFKQLLNNMKNLRILRIVNVSDFIVLLPPFIGFTEVGTELLIDTRNSPFLKDSDGYTKRHNLEIAYLHGIAGSHGVGGKFQLEVKRDLALMNKDSNLLKDKYLIPGHWRVLKNKGMIQLANGSWTMDDHEEEKKRQDKDEDEEEDDDDI